jgi:amidase
VGGLGVAGPHPGRPHGPLAGRTLAVKDNMAVAGAPMRNGPVLLDSYVPDEDATVVERYWTLVPSS